MENKNGWTARPESAPLRRSGFPPEHFYEEIVKANPAAAACDEPGYVDPDLSSGSLEPGTRYWQGFAKAITPRPEREERAMSPGWVAEITARPSNAFSNRDIDFAINDGHEVAPLARGAREEIEIDPLRERVVREAELHHNSNYPG
jgi:hypothetical protein